MMLNEPRPWHWWARHPRWWWRKCGGCWLLGHTPYRLEQPTICRRCGRLVIEE